MKRRENVWMLVLLVGLVMGIIGILGQPSALAADPPESGPVNQWSGGAAVGFLGNTPDDTAFAFNLHADRFLERRVSIGPLLQMGITGDMTLVGLSGQGKYWIDIPDTSDRAKLVLQGGLGFAHADMRGSDTSWLIPLGVGLDYKVDPGLFLTTTFLLNFTDLNLGGGNSTTVMPGLTFGIRF